MSTEPASRAQSSSLASLPECWGHRGASAAFPENTMASFELAAQDGADAIETDVHITADDVIVLFHDSNLGRTTNGSGKISEQTYYGGLEHVRTVAEPTQKIPTFNELCDFLMKPQFRHVKANIDIKPDNDPDRLFRIMKSAVSQYKSFETTLSPRLILGLWHPKFLSPAREHVPTLRRIHIGSTPSLARNYFWDTCDGFSMYFASLVPDEGQKFLRDAQAAGKSIMVWTVNRPDEMVEATRWGVTAVLTDCTDLFNRLKQEMSTDFERIYGEYVGTAFRWATWKYYSVPLKRTQSIWDAETEELAGESFALSHERNLAQFSPASIMGSETSTAVGTPMVKAAEFSLPAPNIPIFEPLERQAF